MEVQEACQKERPSTFVFIIKWLRAAGCVLLSLSRISWIVLFYILIEMMSPADKGSAKAL